MEESARGLEDRFLAMFGELAQEFFGRVVEVGRHVNDEVHVQVAATPSVEVLDTLVAYSMHRPVGRTGGDVHHRALTQGGDLDRRTEDGLGEGNVRLVVQVVAVSFEAGIVLDSKVDEQPPVGTAARPGRTAVTQTHRRTVFNAGGHLHRERRRLVSSTLAPTVRARRLNTRTHSVATRTGHRGHHLAQYRVADPPDLAEAGAFERRARARSRPRTPTRHRSCSVEPT